MDNIRKQIAEEIVQRMREAGGDVAHGEKSGIIRVNGEFALCVFVAPCVWTPAGRACWDVRINRAADITVVARLDGSGLMVMDYYLLPTIDMPKERFRLAEYNGIELDAYRADTLDFLISLARRVKIGAA